MRRKPSTKNDLMFVWPEQSDSTDVDTETVRATLKSPKSLRRGRYLFKDHIVFKGITLK